MWSRIELKSRAKIAFKRNYWKCVLVAFILSILGGWGAANTTTNLDTDELIDKKIIIMKMIIFMIMMIL